MTQRSNIRRCGSQDRLTVPQMRGMLEMIRKSVQSEPEMEEFAARLQHAIEELDELRSVALAVMIEAETERAAFANPREDAAVKPC
jgi:hypothetical protein